MTDEQQLTRSFNLWMDTVDSMTPAQRDLHKAAVEQHDARLLELRREYDEAVAVENQQFEKHRLRLLAQFAAENGVTFRDE